MEKLEDLLERLIKKSYVRMGSNAINAQHNLIRAILSEKKLPVDGWSDLSIEMTLLQLSAMDCNNFLSNVGVGEREGRIFSDLVARRNFRFSHGIGRSGDISEAQPKACGSSLLYKITTFLALHAIQLSGLKSIRACIVLPLATGMSISLCLRTLGKERPTAKYVIWSRIDQKSCFKAILSAGYIPLIVQNIIQHENDAILTNLDEINHLCNTIPREEILCVLSTTSCFAPRHPDSVDVIAKMCALYDIPHVINNAYGVQCKIITRLLQRALVIGRVDYIVQSTDKNFMVPVGGSIVTSGSKEAVDALAAMYPGRASSQPILDLFITLLSMGEGL